MIQNVIRVLDYEQFEMQIFGIRIDQGVVSALGSLFASALYIGARVILERRGVDALG